MTFLAKPIWAGKYILTAICLFIYLALFIESMNKSYTTRSYHYEEDSTHRTYPNFP
jgi:hypothetical protein